MAFLRLNRKEKLELKETPQIDVEIVKDLSDTFNSLSTLNDVALNMFKEKALFLREPKKATVIARFRDALNYAVEIGVCSVTTIRQKSKTIKLYHFNKK